VRKQVHRRSRVPVRVESEQKGRTVVEETEKKAIRKEAQDLESTRKEGAEHGGRICAEDVCCCTQTWKQMLVWLQALITETSLW
jgi:hypothetical protein